MGKFVAQERLGLFDTPPSRTQVRFALTIVGLLFVATLIIVPIRGLRWGEVTAFVPVINAVMFVGELITATLLFAQATVFRSRSLTVLATGYVFAGLLLVPHALTVPGAFSANGLLGAGIDTAAWLYTCRRVAFPIAVILYVQLRRADSLAERGLERPPPRVAMAVLGAVALAAAITLLATGGQDLLPPYFLNRSDPIYANALAYHSVIFVLYCVATILLYRQRTSVLDMWLLVAISGWLIQSLLFLTVQSRFTLGWYCLYVLMLASHLVVMFALIAECNRLYMRLALSTAARSREREARQMSMDAMAAAISHEVGQPLSAVTTNAMAGLSWLARPQPDVEKAIPALRATLDAGQRTFDVMKTTRAMFGKGSGTATEFSLNALVRETASLLDAELTDKRISVQCTLDETLPPILADRGQLRQVLVNLLTNAIEAMAATRGRPRHLRIRTAPVDGQNVLVEVGDTGIGIPPAGATRIFDAFFTTKDSGTGLGLSLCRTIVEEHGGRLWASPGEQHGATFHLQLPRRGLHYENVESAGARSA